MENDMETGVALQCATIEGAVWGVPMMRIVVLWGLCWGPPLDGNYHKDSLHKGSKIWR